MCPNALLFIDPQSRKQTTRSLNILATRTTDRSHNTLADQRITEGLHLRLRRAEIGRVRDLMEADQIDTASHTVEQSSQLGHVARRIVQTTHHNILETHTTLVRKVVFSQNIGNLMMAGRDISTSKMAFSSTRVMGTCAMLGQAAGTAAALAVEKGISPRAVGTHMDELQDKLMEDDCWLPAAQRSWS